jgi:DnaK suppressor protein
MTYLTPEQREALRRKLEQRARALRGEIAADSREDLNAEPEMAALQRDIDELREIEDALARLHKPVFGFCQDCGDEISLFRLEANPAAKRCAPCQSNHERT